MTSTVDKCKSGFDVSYRGREPCDNIGWCELEPGHNVYCRDSEIDHGLGRCGRELDHKFGRRKHKEVRCHGSKLSHNVGSPCHILGQMQAQLSITSASVDASLATTPGAVDESPVVSVAVDTKSDTGSATVVAGARPRR